MEKIKNIHQRILSVMAELDYIQKGDKTVNNQYRFVSHDQVTSAIHPMLVKHGIVCVPNVKSLTQDGNRTSVCLSVQFVNVDDPKDLVTVESWGYGVDQSDKGPGKAVSYAFKYAILKLFCLETGDDPDQDTKTVYEPKKEVLEPKPMSVTEFRDRLRLQVKEHYDLYKLEDFVTYLQSEKGVDSRRIMEQAIDPKNSERFCKSWKLWYSSE